MRLVTISLIALALTACGPSQEEIDNTAIITCNIMGESKEMDAAMRIREINAAREKIGADPYLEGDYQIRTSIRFGLCERLVKDDPDLLTDLAKLQKEVADRRIAELREKLRILDEKEAEAAVTENADRREKSESDSANTP